MRFIPASLLSFSARIFLICTFAVGGPSAFASSALPTTTTLTVTAGGSPATTVSAGTVITLTAAVTSSRGSITTGQVMFCDALAAYCKDIHIVGSAQLTSAGTAIVRFVPGMGAHSYKAVFVGTNASATSASPAAALTVPVSGTATSTALSRVDIVGPYNLGTTVTGSGLPVAPTGTISFRDTSNSNFLLGTASLTITSSIFKQTNPPTSIGAGNLRATVVGDFNGDGIADVAFTSQYGVTLLIGHGDGTFTAGSTLSTGFSPSGLVAADFNEDGMLDLAYASNGYVTVLLGHGDGTFTVSSFRFSGDSSFNLSVADFNRDGHQDLAICNQTGNTVSILLGNGDGTFTATAVSPKALPYARETAVGDFNGDGNPDIVVATGGSGSGLTILLGNGDGTFFTGVTPSTGPVPFTVAVADFNGDGNDDIAVADDGTSTVTILLSKGDGTFTTVSAMSPTGAVGLAMSIGDFNGDGKADFSVANEFGNSVTTSLGYGDGTFSTSTFSLPVGSQLFGIASGDFNGDGLSDVAVTNLAGATSYILLSNPTWSVNAGLSGVTITGTGNHQIQASYPGDTKYLASASNLLSLAAQPVATTLAVAANPSASLFGQQVVLTATLAPYLSQGHTTDGEFVTFFNGSVNLGTGVLQSGVATLNITSLPAGANQISASFAGDLNFTTSTSGTLPYTVINATTLALTANPATTSYGSAITLTATLSPYTAAGKTTDAEQITFYSGASPIGTATLSGGIATFNKTTSLPAGSGNFTAKYPGETYFTAATSNAAAYTLTRVTPSITWTPPASATYTGKPFSALLTASSATAGNIVYTATPTGGSPSTLLATTVFSAGSYTLTATFFPSDTTDYTTATATVSFTVTPATLTLVPADATRAYGNTNPALTGSVTGALNSDQFTVTGATTATTTSPVGTYSITYTIAGANLPNYTYTPQTATLTVTQASSTLAWTAPSSIQYGVALSSAQLNATASAPGTITYSQPAGTILTAGTYTLSASFVPTDATDYKPSTASVSLAVTRASLSLSANNINRTYGSANPAFSGTIAGAVNGDTFTETFNTSANTGSIVGPYPIVPTASGSSLANYSVTTTNGVLTISQAGTATTFALSNSNLTLTATVASLTSGAPTGNVGFYVGQTLAGTGTLANGVASFTLASFPTGNVTLTAQYSGDANFTQSSSPALLVLAVTPAASSLTVSTTGTVTDSLGLVVAPGYVGTVQFSCSGLPKGAACTFSPASQAFTGSGNTANITLSIQTGTTVAGLVQHWRGIDLAGLFSLPGLFAAMSFRRKQRYPLRGTLLTALLLCGLGLSAIGCATSASTTSTPTPASPTPSGTSTFQVLATGSGGLSQTTNVTLNVQ